ncbi:MAG: mechanosensitive ion channel [Gammaproteobacteria bacterium]|nr:mechanosensitive ion channel [Gammaproteobacteria bacterium]
MDVQQWTLTLTEAIVRVTQRISDYLPHLFGFLALLIVGWIIAVVLRMVTYHIAARAFDRLGRSKSVQPRVAHSHTYRSAPRVISRVVFWTVLLFFLAAAIEALGLPAVSNVLGIVTAYLPRILLGVLIIFAGLWVGEFVRASLARVAATAGITRGDIVARAAQSLVVFVAAIIAAEQIGIDSTALITILVTGFAVTFGAAALAFGLGAKSTVSNIVAGHYVQKAYRPGDSIRIGNYEGRIVEITHTAVLLDAPEGQLMVPTARFSNEVSILLSGRK